MTDERKKPGPKAKAGVKRSRHLGIRLTPAEFEVLAAKARKAGQTESDFVRGLVLREARK